MVCILYVNVWRKPFMLPHINDWHFQKAAKVCLAKLDVLCLVKLDVLCLAKLDICCLGAGLLFGLMVHNKGE